MSFHLRAALVALAVILLAPATAGAIPPDGPIDPCDRPKPPKYCNPDPPPPADRTPIGHLDQVAIKNGRLHIAGWSIDPDTTGSIKVQILVDGKHRQTVDASISRPDVAAAHPGYGDAHGFDVALDPPLRHTRVCVYGLNTNGGASGALGCGRAKSAFSVLSVNMQGTDSTWGPWRERWARIARWMGQTNTLPDVMTLQEVPASKWWMFPWPHLDPAEYESLALLIRRIKEHTGANYRIAYLAAGHVPQGVNALYQGRAMIYNADRVRNTTTLVNAWAVPHDSTLQGVHMRRSFPCQSPSGELPETCGLLDGDGRHWTVNDSVGLGAQTAVFELIERPDRHVLVHNIHWNRSNPGVRAGLDSLTSATWNSWAPRTKLLPPIVAGDFNGDYEISDRFEDRASAYIDYVLIGKTSAWNVPAPHSESEIAPSPMNEYGHPVSSCGDPNTLWADHCGMFTQFFPED